MYHLSAQKKTIWLVVISFFFLLNTVSLQAYGKEKANMTSAKASTLLSANKIKGMTVKNNMDEKLGTIHEIIFDDNDDNVQYLLISSGSRLYPVTWFNVEQTPDYCILNVSRADLKQAPSINSIDIYQLSSPDFRKKVEDFYSSHIPSQEKSVTKRAAGWVKEKTQQTFGSDERADLYECSEIIGLEVQNPRGQQIAEVEDLVIDSRHGKIVYGLAGFGGFWGIGEKTAAIPWSALDVQPQRDVAILDATTEKLNNCVIEEDRLDKLAQPQFARQIHENFGVEPYWQVFGFEPPEGAEFSDSAWQPGSKYNRNFDASRIVTIEGTIKSVGTFRPEKGALPGLRLKVKTKEGETVTVQSGPRKYLMQQDMNFTAGNDIAVTGSRTTIGTKSVIMASEIKMGDKTLKLRDQDGRPLWNLENAAGQPQQGMEKPQSETQD